jgi:hypothetical protein
MTQKGNRGKPTRKEVSNAITFLGQKVKYLEEYCVANENMFALFLEFTDKKDEFLKFVEKKVKQNEEKKLEKTDKTE